MKPDIDLPEKIIAGKDGILRCQWVGQDRLYQTYHDREWGVPSCNDRKLFEQLCLEGFQSGLSWLVVLRKREDFRKAFSNFDIAALTQSDTGLLVRELMQNRAIIRHKGKIDSVFNNARAACFLIEEYGTLHLYLQSFLSHATSAQNCACCLAKDLKKRGFRFVGEKTIYAFMQAVGMVNDHAPYCFCHSDADHDRARHAVWGGVLPSSTCRLI